MRVPALDVAQARVRGDAEEPRAQRQRGVVLMESAVGADEGLLRAVVGRVGIARDPERYVVDATSIPLDQSGVGVGVPGEAQPDDVLVGAGQRSLRYAARARSGHCHYPVGRRVVSRILSPRYGPDLAGSRVLSHAGP